MLLESVAERWDPLFPQWLQTGLRETLSASMPRTLPELSYVHAIPLWTVGPIWVAPVTDKPESVRGYYGLVQEEPDWLEWLATPFARWHWREGTLFLRQMVVQTIPCRSDTPWVYPVHNAALRMDCPLYLTDGNRYEIVSHERVVTDRRGNILQVVELEENLHLLVGVPSLQRLTDLRIIVDGREVTATVGFSRTERSRRAELVISRALKPKESELHAIQLERMAGAERIWSPFYPINIIEWDGVSDLDLPEGTAQVEVQTIPRTVVSRIVLHRESDNLYRSNYHLRYGIYYGSQILPTTGNYVQIAAHAEELYALALIPLWDLESNNAHITRLKATGNLRPSRYVVFYSDIGIVPQSDMSGLWDTAYDLFNYYPGGLVLKNRAYVNGNTRVRVTGTVYNPLRGLGFATIGGRTSIHMRATVSGIRSAGASPSGRTTVQVDGQVVAIRNVRAESSGGTTITLRWVHTIPVSLQTVNGRTQIRAYPGTYFVARGGTTVYAMVRRVAVASCQLQGGTSTSAEDVIMRNAHVSVPGSTSPFVSGTRYRSGQVSVTGNTLALASGAFSRNRSMSSTGGTAIDLYAVRIRNSTASAAGSSIASAAWLRSARNGAIVSGSTQIQASALKGQLKMGQVSVAGSSNVQLGWLRRRSASISIEGTSNTAAYATVSQAIMAVCHGTSMLSITAIRARTASASIACGSQIGCTTWRIRVSSAQVSAGSSVQVAAQKSAPVELTSSGGTSLSVTARRIAHRTAYVDGYTRVVEQDDSGYNAPSTVTRHHSAMFGEDTVEPTDTESINILNSEAKGSTTRDKLLGWQYNNIRLYIWGGKRVINYRKNNYLSGEEY